MIPGACTGYTSEAITSSHELVLLLQGHYEHAPFDNDTMRSAYHIRELDVYRLKQLQQPLDVFLSHDWPRGIAKHGKLQQLLARKAFLRSEVCSTFLA